MDTLIRPSTAARARDRSGLPSHKGALETMIPDVYIRRFPPADTATVEQEPERKTRNARARRPRVGARRK